MNFRLLASIQCNLMARSYKLATRNLWRNNIRKKTMMGEISIGKGGSRRRTGSSTGSVARTKNWTIGLNGSGLTQLINARINISQYMIVKIILTMEASASIKFAKTNIFPPLPFRIL